MDPQPPNSACRDDEALVADARRGLSGCLAQLVERHAAQVLAVLERAVGDHHLALDLSQEIWIKVQRGLAGFRAGLRFRPWLYGIVFNHLRDHERRRGRHPLRLIEDEPGTSWAFVDGVDGVDGPPGRELEEREAIDAALAEVPEPFRSALHLVDVIGLAYDEAAASLGCTSGTVKSRVHRGRLAFQAAYRPAPGFARANRPPTPPPIPQVES